MTEETITQLITTVEAIKTLLWICMAHLSIQTGLAIGNLFTK
jgi:hypothetical protein